MEGKLTGRWDISSISASVKPDSIFLKEFDSMLHTLLINASIEFEKDHKFIAQIAGKSYSGTWETDSRSHKIKLLEIHKESTYSIAFTNENEILLKGNEQMPDYAIKLKRQAQLDKQKK